MTIRKIQYAWNKIDACKSHGYYMEALLRNYHLNLDIIRHILSTQAEDYLVKGKKIKTIVGDFLLEIERNTQLKSILNKRNLKTVKPWLDKMDAFFKTLKQGQP